MKSEWSRELWYDCQVELRKTKGPRKVDSPKCEVRQLNILLCFTPAIFSYYVEPLNRIYRLIKIKTLPKKYEDIKEDQETYETSAYKGL